MLPAQSRAPIPNRPEPTVTAHLIILATSLLTWLAMLATGPGPLAEFARLNGALQLLLFVLVVSLPLWRTGRMSWVDIAWPWGLVLIGGQVLAAAPGGSPRVWIVGALYLVVGLRMGLGALVLAKTTGEIVRIELPRYRYRQEMLEREGSRHIPLRKQLEAMNQGFANASMLSVPAALVLAEDRKSVV